MKNYIMGTFESFRRVYGALKDTTTVSLAAVNSDFKDLDIAIVRATNHDECPPKEYHVRRIFSATCVAVPRADVAYCIHALSRRLLKTKNWIVAVKILIVFHRILREGDPSFREELLNYSNRRHIFEIPNFRDGSSLLAWDCSTWVRTYALFLEERLESFRVLRFDIETERLTKSAPRIGKMYSRTRLMNSDELLEQLPAMQQLLHRLIACQPQGTAYHNDLIQYALALILKESFKIYGAINDGIINLVDMFFDMSKKDAVKSLQIYKKSGKQAKHLGEFYNLAKHLNLARNFHFPTLRQPPPSFLATMEEYVKEVPSSTELEYRVVIEDQAPQGTEKIATQEIKEVEKKEAKPESKVEEAVTPLIATDTNDLLGLNEIDPKPTETNTMALAVVQYDTSATEVDKTSSWELALLATPSNTSNLGDGYNKLLLDNLYEDDLAKKQIQVQHTSYNYEYGMQHNPFQQEHQQQQDPFVMSGVVAPPTNAKMAMMQQQQQEEIMNQQYYLNWYQQSYQQENMFLPDNNQPLSNQYSQQQQAMWNPSLNLNPFGDPIGYPQRNYGLI